MWYIVWISTLLTISSCYCNSQVQGLKLELEGIEVTQTFPLMNKQGKLLGYDTAYTYVYGKADTLLYKIFYQFDSSIYDNQSNKIETIKSETRYHYFIYTKGNSFGYDFDLHKSRFSRKIPVDSVFKNEWIFANNLYPMMRDNNVALKYEYHNKELGMYKEYFTIKGKEDSTLSGSVLLEYTNKIAANFYSLIKELDTIKDMKLYKVNIVADRRYFKNFDFTMDRFESNYEIENIPNDRLDEARYYLSEYRKKLSGLGKKEN